MHTQACKKLPCQVNRPLINPTDARKLHITSTRGGKSQRAGSAMVDEAMGAYFQHAEKLGILSRQAEIDLAKEIESGRKEVLLALMSTPLLYKKLKELLDDIQKKDLLIEKAVEKNEGGEMDNPGLVERKGLEEGLKKILMQLHRSEKLKKSLRVEGRRKASSSDRAAKKFRAIEDQIFQELKDLDLHLFVTESVAGELKRMIVDFESSEKDILECRTRSGMTRKELAKLIKEFRDNPRLARKRSDKMGLKPQDLMYLHWVASEAEKKKRSVLKEAAIPSSQLRKAYQKLSAGQERIDRSRHRMVESNLKLVAYVARRYIGKGVPFADLVQEGNIGLMKAVDKFDYRMGCKLATYAIYWIRQSITRAVVDQSRTIRLPLRRVEAINRLFRTAHHLSQKLMREPTCEEMAEKMQIDTDQVLDLLDSGTESISLDSAYGQESERQLVDWVEDEKAESPSRKAFEHDLIAQMDASLSSLKPREEKILRLRFGIGEDTEHTLEEIGRDFQVSRERIRQIESKALQKLRQLPKYRPLKSFLES